MAKIVKGEELRCSGNLTMGEFFFECCERFGDRICQIDATSGKQESYSQVKTRSVRVARELQKRGITHEDFIVSCTKVTLDNIIPILASFYLGAKVANLDPSLSVRQTKHLLSLVSPKIVFVEEESVALIEESLKDATFKCEIVVFGKSHRHSEFSDFDKPQVNERGFKPTKVDIHETSVIFFSSGTTGLPKAICHSNYSFLNVTHSFNQSGFKCDVVLSFTSFYWVSAMILLTNSFMVGGHRIFCAKEPETTFQVIEKYKVTLLFLAPILTYKLTSFEEYHKYNTSSLSNIITGGTPISTIQLQRLRNVFKHTSIILGYGLSETGLVTAFNPSKDRELMMEVVGSCGRPLAGASIKVVDLSTGECLGQNQKGEICVKSPSLMVGYHRMDSKVFDEDGFLRTGDIGYYDTKNCFYVIERVKEMFKYLSWHVVPSAIEQVLLEHPMVKEAVVFGTPRSEEEGEVPTACVVLKEKCNTTAEEVEEFVAESVSDYEKLRGGVIFVEELMKTPSGKLMRKEIRSSILGKM